MNQSKIALFIPLFLGMIAGSIMISCSSSRTLTKYDQIYSRARQVAVLPLVNLTNYPYAGRIAAELITTQLYAQSKFKLMEKTQMQETLKNQWADQSQMLDRTAAIKVGNKLEVDTVIYGAVTEFRYKRGLDENPVVGISVRMLDVKTGEILWADSKSEMGGCLWFCHDSLTRLAQQICYDLVEKLVEQ